MPATVPGLLESQQTSPAAAAAAQTADFIVEVIISVLANRPDAASILASVTSRIAIASGPVPGMVCSASSPAMSEMIQWPQQTPEWEYAARPL